MLKHLIIIQSPSLDPYFNQAIEASLTETVDFESLVLFVWANDKTVIIGKNQNAFRECNVAKLKADDGLIARRISGGGAVYHDKGNLNFTFCCTKDNYSLSDNFAVVLSAVQSFGIKAELSGRNDCTIDGKKFSGNAFYVSSNGCFHHGTILINTRASEIAKYLNVSDAKLSMRAVKSVPARVTNLGQFNKDASYQSFSSALKNSFVDYWQNKYASCGGLRVSNMTVEDIDVEVFARWHTFFSDNGHIMGDDIQYNFGLEHRFDWGTADLRLQLEDGIIQKAKLYTDSLDQHILAKERALIGKNIAQKNTEVDDILEVIRGIV